MKPRAEDRNVQVSGVQAEGFFGLSQRPEDQAHILSMLRDRIYSDKVLAVLREYASNAWDAHVEAGIPNKPIQVTLPSVWDTSELVIRDFGPGLPEELILDPEKSHFTRYGFSTKRDDDKGIGTLGIGCKAGFAYASAFTVVSYHGGKKSSYGAMIESSGRGKMSKLGEVDCGDETGLEIRVPILQKDNQEFRRKAAWLFAFFTPKPDINISVPGITGLEIGPAILTKRDGDNRWIAAMGPVPYRLNTGDFTKHLAEEDMDFLSRQAGILRFEIGEVDVSVSRETLELTEHTIKAVGRKVQAARAALDERLQQLANLPDLTQWQRRLRLKDEVAKMQVGVRSVNGFTLQGVHVDKFNRKSFRISDFSYNDYQRKTSEKFRFSSTSVIPVDAGTTLVINDGVTQLGARLAGSGLYTNKIRVITPINGKSLKRVGRDLQRLFAVYHLAGLPVRLASTMDVKPQFLNPDDEKYSKRLFKWGRDKGAYHEQYSHVSSTGSKNWDLVHELPDEPQVYVQLYRFEPVGISRQEYREAGQVLKTFFGVPDDQAWPEVLYGIKRLSGKPLPIPEGWVEWKDWHSDKLLKLLEKHPNVVAALENDTWVNAQVPPVLTLTGLPKQHALRSMYLRRRECVRAAAALSTAQKNWTWLLRRSVRTASPELLQDMANRVEQQILDALKPYPLIELHGGFAVFTRAEKERKEWVRYVNNIDRYSTESDTP